MKEFFAVSAWENSADTIKFQSIKGNLSGPDKQPKQNASKKKAKRIKNKKTKAENIMQGKGPIAPELLHSKIKVGRIEKQKNVKNKKQQQKIPLTPALAKAAAAVIAEANNANGPDQQSTTVKNTLTDKLKAELMGGRFRYLNEQLYTMNSKKAENLFRDDPGAFGAYHEGYRHQVEKWPMNPLDRIIKTIRRLPKTMEIGDFGCGDGKLAKSVPHKVYSMDLVSCREDIIACNIASTPLQPQSIDVAVYCLSLMGTNLNDFILEANRVLKLHGSVYIAEIQSRFEDVRQFVRFMNSCGFELIKKDVAKNFFYFFQFKKMRNVGKVAILQPFSLKPCLYRKR